MRTARPDTLYSKPLQSVPEFTFGENVLRPLSTEENIRLLTGAGFREVEVFAKWYNFASFIAFRG